MMLLLSRAGCPALGRTVVGPTCWAPWAASSRFGLDHDRDGSQMSSFGSSGAHTAVYLTTLRLSGTFTGRCAFGERSLKEQVFSMLGLGGPRKASRGVARKRNCA